MFKDKLNNWDHKTLAGDHTTPRVHGGRLADRLLHNTCNSQRRDGSMDHIRPAVRGVHPKDWTANGEPAATHSDATALAMDW